MLCRKLRQTIFTKSTLKNNVHYHCLTTSRYLSKRCLFLNSVFAAVSKSNNSVRMSSIRFVIKDLNLTRLWCAWTRNFIVNNVVKRCRRERSVREVLQCFRHSLLKPRSTFLLSATAAFKSRDEDDEAPPSCTQSITDEELEALVTELEGVDHLSRSTLYCTSCGKRLLIEKKLPGLRYCACKDPKPAEESSDGWVPYMEAEDVIIWRKEYKPGQGLYAYKVYGRYPEVMARDFAAVQVDGAYRRKWDAAVASLALVEGGANGLGDQDVLHWEVMWPRLFANRDYVYIRRHREFDARTPATAPRSELVFQSVEVEPEERPSVHSRAKRKAREIDRLEGDRPAAVDDKVFIIVSRSCTHPNAPETKHAIRVTEYWSHMVVRSINGVSQPGMEFVLTYYDEPAVGGLPTGVASWATGRAAPTYLGKMRRAAVGYGAWASTAHQDLPEFTPFGGQKQSPEEISSVPASVREQDMESSKDGPELDNGAEHSRDQSTQTDCEETAPSVGETKTENEIEPTLPKKNTMMVSTEALSANETQQPEGDSDKLEEEGNSKNGRWWRYLYPFYYFV